MRLLASTTLIASFVCVYPMSARADGPQAQPSGQGQAKPAKGAAPAKGNEPATPTRSTVVHVPPSEAQGDQELRIVAVVDAAWTEASLVVRYRAIGSQAEFAESPFERSSAGGYFATIPAESMIRPGVEYYIVGQHPDGSEILHFGSASAPHPISIAPTMSTRWAEKELRRLGGFASAISLNIAGQDFGNRYANADRYGRAELDFTHRILSKFLYSISLGYGAVEGETPNGRFADAISERMGARYGYAGVRLKLHKSVWVDGRASLGFDTEGFIAGGGGAITLGRPWRSNINFGAEYMQGMGPNIWFQLQWDTVAPFLMTATLYRTDWPGATLAHGARVIYGVIYPINPRITVRGSVSFGSRDGPGSFGGGFGTSIAF